MASRWDIEMAHLGYFGSQDPFYVANLKGTGHLTSKPLLILIKGIS